MRLLDTNAASWWNDLITDCSQRGGTALPVKVGGQEMGDKKDGGGQRIKLETQPL